jgi:hypothetical protein
MFQAGMLVAKYTPQNAPARLSNFQEKLRGPVRPVFLTVSD